MTLTTLLLSQLTDVFRIGLIVALVITMRRTQAITGRAVPLLAGMVFVAVILPVTMPPDDTLVRIIAVGLVANAIILGLTLGAAWLVDRLRR